MKNNKMLFVLCLLCFISSSISAHTVQSLFNQLANDLKEYKIESEESYRSDSGRTKSVSVSYNHPYLIIICKDIYEPRITWSSDFTPGIRKAIINMLTCSFFKSESWVSVRDAVSGIEFSDEGSKTIDEAFGLYADKLVCNRIYTTLKQLQKAIIDEGFTGRLGQPNNKVHPSSKSNKSFKSKLGKYVQ